MVKNVMYLSPEKIKDYILLNGKFRIAFLGDSLTSAEWIHPNWREIVEYVLKEELCSIVPDWRIPSWSVRGINCGFDGSGSTDHLKRLESEVLYYKPDLVISLFGGNDLYLGISPDQHKNNISELIREIKAKVPFLIFCTSIACGKSESDRNKQYRLYADKVRNIFPIVGTQFIDMYKEYEKFDLDKFYTFVSEGNEVVDIKPGDIDYLHPNQLGNAYIAKIVLREGFGVEFDPEKYLRESYEGKMFPGY